MKHKLIRYGEFVHYHPAECLQKKTECPNKCGTIITKRTDNSHFGVECPEVLMLCEDCGKAIKRRDIADHELECPKKPTYCVYCCENVEDQDGRPYWELLRIRIRKNFGQKTNVGRQEVSCHERSRYGSFTSAIKKPWNQANLSSHWRDQKDLFPSL